MNIVNPATQEVITTLLTDDQQSIAKKVTAAKAGQKKWAGVPLSERIADTPWKIPS